MKKLLRASLATLGILIAGLAASHPATELYIPIGESPGVSGADAEQGRIVEMSTQPHGFVLRTDDGEHSIRMDEGTKIYVQYPGKAERNRIGNYDDCRPGRRVEAWVDDGVTRWIKIDGTT